MNNDMNEMTFKSVLNMLKKQPRWIGTMSDLRASLNKMLNRREKTLMPSSPSALRMVLNRVVNRLRNQGVSVKFGRANDHIRTRFVKFSR